VATGLLLAKLVATPAILALVTWVERRFGPSLAGLVFGFPLVTSLASVFLAIEQGAAFARDTTVGLLVGIATFALFVLAYAHAARRGAPWPLAVAVALALYLPAAYGGSRLGDLGRGPAAVLAAMALGAAAAAMPRGLGDAAPRPHGRWELPLRIAVATTLVVAVTALAQAAGPQLTGILLLVPVTTATVASFVLARAGRAAVVRMLRGLAWGCFSFVAFFIVAGTALTTMPPWAAFLLAGLAALGCSGMTWRLAISRLVVPADDAVD
jgi:hypothetical protein